MDEGEERASGIGGATQPVGVVYVPVGLAGCNGIVRFIVVEQDVPSLLPVGVMRTLPAGLDLDDNGDKVIFRQVGGKSSLRTLKSGHTAIRADQFDPDSYRSYDQGVESNYMSAIDHSHQRPRCTSDIKSTTTTQAVDNDATVTRRRNPPQRTSTDGNGTLDPHTTTDPPSSYLSKDEQRMNRLLLTDKWDLLASHQGTCFSCNVR